MRLGASDTDATEILTAVVLAVVGGSGIVGILFYFLRRYLEKRLTANEDRERRQRDTRIRRMQIEDELHHCYGRLLFWLYRAATTGIHNGELDSAFANLQKAEAKKKDLDREIISGNEID